MCCIKTTIFLHFVISLTRELRLRKQLQNSHIIFPFASLFNKSCLNNNQSIKMNQQSLFKINSLKNHFFSQTSLFVGHTSNFLTVLSIISDFRYFQDQFSSFSRDCEIIYF